jgi:hypothetical protein
LDLEIGHVSVWYEGSDISEVVFVGPNATSLIYINSTNAEGDGDISLYHADAASLERAVLISSLPAPTEASRPHWHHLEILNSLSTEMSGITELPTTRGYLSSQRAQLGYTRQHSFGIGYV